jgi:hypothetical protein
MPRRGRSGKWLLAEAVNVGLVLVLVLCAAWAGEPEDGSAVLPADVVYLVLAAPPAVFALLGIFARPVAGALELLVGALFLVSGFVSSSWPGLAAGALLLFVGALFVLDAVERDLGTPASTPMRSGSASAGGGFRGRRPRGTRNPAPRTPSRAEAGVEVVTLAGLSVPPASVAELVRRLRDADLAATAEMLESALATGESMPGASSPDRFALIVADREALLCVLDEQCPEELTELRSVLRADHESRVRRGLWAEHRLPVS